MNARNSTLVLIAALSSAHAWALSNFTPGDLSGITADTVNTLVQTVALSADHRAYMPATALGSTIGIDLGIDVTAVSIPSQFTNAIELATQASADQIPSVIPLIRLSAHKGLPFGLDVGFAFSEIPDTSNPGTNIFTEYAGDLKWTFIKGLALPSLAVRGSATYGQIYFMSTHVYDLDLVASKNLYVIDPYIGLGMQFWNGMIAVPNGITLPFSNTASGTAFHFYAGVPIKLVFLRITPEIDYTTAGFYSYGAKFSLGF
jgi:hypothetical protein